MKNQEIKHILDYIKTTPISKMLRQWNLPKNCTPQEVYDTFYNHNYFVAPILAKGMMEYDVLMTYALCKGDKQKTIRVYQGSERCEHTGYFNWAENDISEYIEPGTTLYNVGFLSLVEEDNLAHVIAEVQVDGARIKGFACVQVGRHAANEINERLSKDGLPSPSILLSLIVEGCATYESIPDDLYYILDENNKPIEATEEEYEHFVEAGKQMFFITDLGNDRRVSSFFDGLERDVSLQFKTFVLFGQTKATELRACGTLDELIDQHEQLVNIYNRK
jgi:hypothetical protein